MKCRLQRHGEAVFGEPIERIGGDGDQAVGQGHDEHDAADQQHVPILHCVQQ